MGRTSVTRLEKNMLDVYRLYEVYFVLTDEDGNRCHTMLKIGGMSPDCVIGKVKKYYRDHPGKCDMLLSDVVSVKIHCVVFIKTISVYPEDWMNEIIGAIA